ncbi:response regulator receiver modulated diguanylate cyclase [Tranquillimonas rosea]|uniref:diguanylate cyclase n=1 Tax=Tranquillimonas rosea TaxID=641238 RepID=A0A1H9WX26_9RHOB|nr:diguanylate cyclase [Tranquillimonas rosea]SES38384.1 response regulator receiver modulated diguanylate cyclase [Tranquillimonas rosea]
MPGHILIVDATSTNRIGLKVKLDAAGYGISYCSDVEAAPGMAARLAPDLVIADADLSFSIVPDLPSRLIGSAAPHRPALLLTTACERPDMRLRGLRAGADDVLPRDLSERDLRTRVRTLLRRRQDHDDLMQRLQEGDLGFAEPAAAFAPPAVLGLIPADKAQGLAWRTAMSPCFDGVLRVLAPADALTITTGAQPPDAFLVAAGQGTGTDGLQLVSELRSRLQTRHSGIVVLHAADPPDLATRALDLGADDVATLPLSPPETVLRLRKQIDRKREADAARDQLARSLQLALRDPLTGLHNRRYADRRLAQIGARSAQSGVPFAVLTLDIDHFKDINDSYGHAAGDAVLRGLAKRLTRPLHDCDLLARIGGEEFLAALPDTDAARARRVAESLCETIRSEPFVLPNGTLRHVTASIGIALGGPGGDGPDGVVQRADAALYAAKARGRDRLEIGPEGWIGDAQSRRRTRSSDRSNRSA